VLKHNNSVYLSYLTHGPIYRLNDENPHYIGVLGSFFSDLGAPLEFGLDSKFFTFQTKILSLTISKRDSQQQIQD